MKKAKVLVVSPDVVGKKMAGPGIRYTEIAKQLSKWFNVTLYAPSTNGNVKFGFTIHTYDDLRELQDVVGEYDFVFAQSLAFEIVAVAIKSKTQIIYDLYNPLPIEALVGNIPTTEEGIVKKDGEYNELLTHLLLYSRSGSYFVCANERQRDFWIGYLAANRVFMPSHYKGQSVEKLMGLLPFGMQDSEPKHTKNVLRGVVNGIDKNSKILIWAGGIWDWFDPLTAIAGVAELSKTHPEIKLVFLGTTHPNKLVGKMSMTDRAIKLSEDLGVRGNNVFFIEGWTDYNDRVNYLLEADAAVSLHQNNLETRLSFRTRILDHFWADLPSVVTTGDWFAELIEHENLGSVVDYNDSKEFQQAVLNVLENSSSIKKNIRREKEGFKWSTIVAGNLKQYIEEHTGSEYALPENFINYYVDIASMGMLKSDSAELQRIKGILDHTNESNPLKKIAKKSLKNRIIK